MRLNVQKSLMQASSLARAGQVAEALAVYDDVLRAYPKNRRAQTDRQKLKDKTSNPPAAMIRSVSALYDQGDWAGLMTACRDMMADYPDSETLWTFTGVAAQKLDRLDVAIPAFQRAADIKPTGKTCANLGLAYEAGELTSRALPWLEKACKAEPKNPTYLLAWGRLAFNMGEFDQAIQALQRHMVQNPNSAEAYNILGASLLQTGEFEASVTAFRRAVKLNAGHAAYFNNMGLALRALGEFDAAVEVTQKALALEPGNFKSHQNLGNLYNDLNDLPAAVEAYASAMRSDPAKHSIQAQKMHVQAKICDWRAWEEAETLMPVLGIQGEPIEPFATLAFDDDPARLRIRAERNMVATGTRWAPDMPKGRDKIRIGYVSADIFDHATLYLLNGVMEQHDRERFEIYAYALNAPRESAAADRFRENVDVFRDIHQLQHAEALDLVREDALDIAIDLKGFTLGGRGRLFMDGLAPIQISYLGFPGTVGNQMADYIIADRRVIPDQEREHYAEKVIYLPHSYQANDDRREIAPDAGTRADHGLPDDAVVLCSFNNCYKISPQEFDIWMRIMVQVPETILWLMDAGPVAAQSLRAQAEQRGVDPDRLVFAGHLPQAEHLARHVHADIFVDTFRCNAHTTASDALWAGLPVVTLPGRQFAARVACSLLAALNMSELIADDVTEYEALILRLVQDRTAMQRLKEKLAEQRRTAPLFDTAGYTRHLEAAYEAAVQRARDGKGFADIEISAN